MKQIITVVIVLLSAVLIVSGCSSKNIKPITGADKMGVILMHGKGGTTSWISPLASSLRAAGVQVITPKMAWHKDRIYDKTFNESMEEINGHVKKMKSNGTKTVYVAGHSLGAIAAAGYSARYDDIDGMILLAPGHFTAWRGFNMQVSDDLQKAEAMIKAGKGENKSNFDDINAGKKNSRYITANIFSSWFSDIGPAEFVENMRNVKSNISVLYVAGSKDRIPQTKNKGYAFDGVPANSKNQFVIIDSGHLDVPRKADEIVIQWLRN